MWWGTNMSPGLCLGRTLAVVACFVVATACGTDADSISDESDATTTPAAVDDLTVEEVLAWIDVNYPGSAPACEDAGRLEVGDVFACDGPASTATVESGGTVIYVLDDSGRAAWNSATDIPSSTDDLLKTYDRVPKGLLCRDLLDPEVDAYPFRQGSTPGVDYFWSLVYWSLEGEPDRMDADQDNIPCETLYDAAVVSNVLAGGQVS